MPHFKLYKQAPLIRHSSFGESFIPNWHHKLQWNDPLLPIDW
jgi:hypothetical protein